MNNIGFDFSAIKKACFGIGSFIISGAVSFYVDYISCNFRKKPEVKPEFSVANITRITAISPDVNIVTYNNKHYIHINSGHSNNPSAQDTTIIRGIRIINTVQLPNETLQILKEFISMFMNNEGTFIDNGKPSIQIINQYLNFGEYNITKIIITNQLYEEFIIT